MQQETRITQERIGVLIGKKGLTKREIEEKTKTRIQVDSEEGLVSIEGEDADGFIQAVETVKAIARGFSPERAAILLEDPDLYLEIIELSEYAGSDSKIERIRGRIIGRDGRSRAQIQDMTATEISVYGKTVGIIGTIEQVKIAREAVEMLIKGVSHESVFSFLEKKRRELKQDMISYYY
ncbi:KH, type 1 [Methanospirillum hungatei JF-1]|jgi:ribosomal RNA assembly protein|uniref:KH, type 1 n=1 Tax=Methanospirillum hungatei JF-1 (strain ATCC 27890 / DSM 864 / NBRC 100397 / JF-1) TaxID=323259 RepID=Q2FN99_METHJ|nr:KH domain-containing protein [Methanospirillum hungatei]ABD42165.1 KH, type 1 [Methanospirillum hungatei JF-1]